MRPSHAYVHIQCTVHAYATHVSKHTHMNADTHDGRYRRLAQKHWLQGLKQRRASQSPERRRLNPLGSQSQGPGSPTSTTRFGIQMHEAHKILLRELKAYPPSPDAIERMALAVQQTSQDVVAAVRADATDALLNDTTDANADNPAFAFLLADAEYHEAVVRVLQVLIRTNTSTNTHTHTS